MGIVNLASGGLDSSLITMLSVEEGVDVYPLFIDYGQLAAKKEWEACLVVHDKLCFPKPSYMDLSGFGKLIVSGLTFSGKDIKEEAFTPGRNLLFLLAASSYAVQMGANAVTIGLLSEELSLFPDQTGVFLEKAEEAIEEAMGQNISVVAPLIEFKKADVIALAKEKGLIGTYSCHAGTEVPCGECISCLET
ncbi:MAG: 7-cyano-7-deazaguanine synthase [Candidatus Electrothrix sp. ATG2]|nr:7-cyano-7-deazaguanine synthase [Candidatus Electrothrix sp. ATG2]